MKNLKQDCDAVGRPSILINTLEMEANIIYHIHIDEKEGTISTVIALMN